MENFTNILAAFNAGKLPSQEQLNRFIDFIKDDVLVQAQAVAGSGNASSQGQMLAKHVGAVLNAYKVLGTNKNGDDLLQEALWHLSEGDLALSTPDVPVDTEEASADADAVRKSLRDLVQIIWSSISSESSEVFHDFSSFARLVIADAAEAVEEQAARAKSTLREVEKEVQDGQRDSLGRDKERMQEEEDVKVQFEHGMDTIKGAGVSAIGAGQQASAKVEDMSAKTMSKLQSAFDKMCERAQKDKGYHDSITTMVNIVEKWLTRTEEAVTSSDIESLIYDPTPEQHVTKAFKALKTLAERLAGGKSLDDLYSKGRQCAVHVQNDEHLQAWFHEFFRVVRRTLDEAGYMRSDECNNTRKDLRVRWKRFFEGNTEWKRDWDCFKAEVSAFQNALDEDKDLRRLRDAHLQLGQAIEKRLIEGSQAATTGLQAAMDQASWFWRDIFQVYMPRFLSFMKDVPIPRMEYVDEDIELVLEDLDISSFNINPAHVFIRNITDIDIQTSATSTPSQTAIGTLTHIRVQAVQLALDEVSFFYKDKRSSVPPHDFSGLITFTLPPKGIDIDVKLRLIPASQVTQLKRYGHKQDVNDRELHHAFHVVELAQAEITSDIDLSITKSNHPMLLSVFKPIFSLRFREALERTLSEHIRSIIEWADGVAWDISKRSEVFRDTGLGSGGALTAAVWSELGKMRRLSSGAWEAQGTGTGVIVEGEKGQAFAMGAEPQILSGEKRGPKGVAAESLEEQIMRDVGGVEVVSGRIEREVEGVMERGRKQLQSFKESVEVKTEQQKAMSGWRSSAFDIIV
ncbi:hypothetical protein BDZ89DRAFT_963742 [Hymenopellis radicata]|nr:hypothetical protein BDZ89DRAFT_963742 [Hymenopellis radicata]